MAGRSELSSNWRVRSAVSLGSSWKDGSNNSESNHPRPTFSDRQDRPKTTSTTPGTPATIRGEDDPRTLQAIEEDRRLYVGNLPYVAKTKDVEELFISNGYQMCVPGNLVRRFIS